MKSGDWMFQKRRRQTAEDAEQSPKLKETVEEVRKQFYDFKIDVLSTSLFAWYYEWSFTNQHGCNENNFGSQPRCKSIKQIMKDIHHHLIFVKCTCGEIIPPDNVDTTNGCNEEGEEYYEGEAYCKCGKEYEWNEWGECDSISQSLEDLQEHINPTPYQR